jgi:SAM-dependent methyltransferase
MSRFARLLQITVPVLENWFQNWFDTPYYHLLYRHRDGNEARDFLARLIDFIGIPQTARVLDLACGKGRHSMELHRLGYEVVGLDLSASSIDEARKFETIGLEFYVHDMRELYWTEHFDAVFNLFTSFGYFHSAEDDQHTINGVADALRPKGIFVLDFLNVNKVVSNMVGEETQMVDGVEFHVSRSLVSGMIEKKITVVDGDNELYFTEQVDALTLNEFTKYFENAGLELEHVFGSYLLEPFNVMTSDRLIMIARKTGQWSI